MICVPHRRPGELDRRGLDGAVSDTAGQAGSARHCSEQQPERHGEQNDRMRGRCPEPGTGRRDGAIDDEAGHRRER